MCFALFGGLGQVDADDFESVEEKIGDFLDRKGLQTGYDQAKRLFIQTGIGETKTEAICNALTELVLLLGHSVRTETDEGDTATSNTQAREKIMPGLEVEAVRSSVETSTEFGYENLTEIQLSDVKNHERAMRIECSDRDSGVLTTVRHQELMIKGDLGLHDLLDTLKGERKQVKKGETKLFSVWFASDNLRALGVLMLLKFSTDSE
jgi:hypothetical protein